MRRSANRSASGQRILEDLAGLELRLLAGLDQDRLAGARVAAFAGLAARDIERAEPDQAHIVALASAPSR